MTRPLRVALVADTFPPLRTSGAVQLRDLAREFVRQGHSITVMLPAADLADRWQLDDVDGVRVLRLRAPRTKDVGYVRRTIGEMAMPFAMRRQLRSSPLAHERFDGVVWYAPSIFHGPFVGALKRASGCKGYLIQRDIFPEWAVDMGLMGRGLPYAFFRMVALQQYSVADVIGVQSPGNLSYFATWQQRDGRTLEVLANWLDPPAQRRCSIRVDQTPLAGRRVFVYAGNMGVAQGMDAILALAEELRSDAGLGFLFVGRGSEVARLKERAQMRGLDNVSFHDEIDPDEIPDLYRQCSAGIVALDPRHKSHNIPGKFLTYVQCGLPVLANVNRGNDLAHLIRLHRVGEVCESNNIEELAAQARRLADRFAHDDDCARRAFELYEASFSTTRAVSQIVEALMPVRRMRASK